MIKAGDRVEWNAVNRVHTGIVTESEDGDLVVIMDNGCSFPLPLLLSANSIKVCDSSNG